MSARQSGGRRGTETLRIGNALENLDEQHRCYSPPPRKRFGATAFALRARLAEPKLEGWSE